MIFGTWKIMETQKRTHYSMEKVDPSTETVMMFVCEYVYWSETEKYGAGWQNILRYWKDLQKEIFVFTIHQGPHQWGRGWWRGYGWQVWLNSPSSKAERDERWRGCRLRFRLSQSVSPWPGQSSSPRSLLPYASLRAIQKQEVWMRHPVSRNPPLHLAFFYQTRRWCNCNIT